MVTSSRNVVKHHHVIDMKQLRKIVTSGIVEEGSYRAIAWRVLFGYLPTNNADWETVLQTKRQLYNELVSHLFTNTLDTMNGTYLKGCRRRRSLLLSRQQNQQSHRMIGSEDSNTSSMFYSAISITSADNESCCSQQPAVIIPKQVLDYCKETGKDLSVLEQINT